MDFTAKMSIGHFGHEGATEKQVYETERSKNWILLHLNVLRIMFLALVYPYTDGFWLVLVLFGGNFMPKSTFPGRN